MFRTSSVHLQERFVQAVCADLVCGNTRTAGHVQPLGSCKQQNFCTLTENSQYCVFRRDYFMIEQTELYHCKTTTTGSYVYKQSHAVLYSCWQETGAVKLL